MGKKLKRRIQLGRGLQLQKLFGGLNKTERRLCIKLLFDSYLETWDNKRWKGYQMDFPTFYWSIQDQPGIFPTVAWKCDAVRIKKTKKRAKRVGK